MNRVIPQVAVSRLLEKRLLIGSEGGRRGPGGTKPLVDQPL
jgi:hypothetical protein